MEIIYYAPNTSMGNLSDEECQLFREWAQVEIENEYSGYQVKAVNEASTIPVWTDDFENEQEIIEFCSRLWDKYE